MLSDLLWLSALAPLVLFLAAARPSPAAPGFRGARNALVLFAFGVLAVTAVAVAIVGPLRTGLIGIAGIGIDLYVDRLSAAMGCLVAFVGFIVVRYSGTYLAGDPAHDRFLRVLSGTLGAVLLLIICGNLGTLALAWLATSWGLHTLLVFYPERRAAQLAARKSAILGRLSDAALLAGLFCLYRAFGSLDYAVIFEPTRAAVAVVGWAPVPVAALFLVSAALLRSAMFPVHGWLLEVMETPTPVSALLHAGIINAGGFVVLRFAHLVVLSTPALDTLAIVGTITAIFGSIVMLTQTSVKVGLAYSTIAQMGFMMLECGLGAFSAALLHLIAHSLYKAHAFLSSGSVIDLARASWTPSPSGKAHPARLAIAIGAVLAVALVVSRITGATVNERPGVFALGAVLLLGLIRLLALGIDERPSMYVLLRVVSLAVVVGCMYFGLQFMMERLMGTTFPIAQAARGTWDVVLVAFVVVAFAAVTFFQSLLPGIDASRVSAAYALVSNGFYVNTFFNRLLRARS